MTDTERIDILEALADYMYSEGCSCCESREDHDVAEKRLALLLDVERYDDESGWNFTKYRTITPVPNEPIKGDSR